MRDNRLCNIEYINSLLTHELLSDMPSSSNDDHDGRYFTEDEHIDSSAGAGDAGKPIKLDADGNVDATMINDGDISHANLSDLSTGADHSYLDQSVVIGSSPVLDGTNFTGIPNGALDETYINADGTVPLTADWNVGNFDISMDEVKLRDTTSGNYTGINIFPNSAASGDNALTLRLDDGSQLLRITGTSHINQNVATTGSPSFLDVTVADTVTSNIYRDSSLLFWYQFAATTGTVAKDSSAVERNLTITAGTSSEGVFTLDAGSSESGTIGKTMTEIGIDPTVDNITVSVWFRTSTSGGDDQYIINNYNWGWILHVNASDSKLYIENFDGAGTNRNRTVSDGTVADGKWHHAVFVLFGDGSSNKLFLDNVEQTTTGDIGTVTQIGEDNKDIFIGRRSSTAHRFFNGQLDDIMLFKRELTEFEMRRLYDDGNKKHLYSTNATFGDIDNRTNFSATGVQTMAADARVEVELRLDIASVGTGGVRPSANDDFTPFNGFEYTIDDEIYYVFEIPADADTSEDIEFHIHWFIDEAFATNSGEVNWQVTYRAVKEDGTEPVDSGGSTATISSGDINIPATALSLLESTTGAIIAANIEQDDVIGLTLKRIDIIDGSDPSAEPIVVSVEVHYTANKLGAAL